MNNLPATSQATALDTIITGGHHAAPITNLPQIWQDIAAGHSTISAQNVDDYVMLARLFLPERPQSLETLTFYGNDLHPSAYPDFIALSQEYANQTRSQRVIKAVQEVFDVFDYQMPGSFYHALLVGIETEHMVLRACHSTYDRDQMLDAAVHAMFMTSQVGLRVQSAFSKQGLMFHHMHNCGCITPDFDGEPFEASINSKSAGPLARTTFWATMWQHADFADIPVSPKLNELLR